VKQRYMDVSVNASIHWLVMFYLSLSWLILLDRALPLATVDAYMYCLVMYYRWLFSLSCLAVCPLGSWLMDELVGRGLISLKRHLTVTHYMAIYHYYRLMISDSTSRQPAD
jgi:hypothetical protein